VRERRIPMAIKSEDEESSDKRKPKGGSFSDTSKED
jgi:hypothetical protein